MTRRVKGIGLERPGKYVPPEELQEAREKAWLALMNEARKQATMVGRRVRVVAVRGVRRNRWTYLIECGSDCAICMEAREKAES